MVPSCLDSDKAVWRAIVASQYGSSVVNSFSPLVDRGLLTWKEVMRFAEIPHFLQRIEAQLRNHDVSFIQENNPEMAALRGGCIR